MSIMLGVRRAGVTISMRTLEQRGRIVLVELLRLIELAASSYGVPEAEFRRIIG